MTNDIYETRCANALAEAAASCVTALFAFKKGEAGESVVYLQRAKQDIEKALTLLNKQNTNQPQTKEQP